MSYENCYPIFESCVKDILQRIEKRIAFNKISKSEILFLNDCKNLLNELLDLFNRKPTISNVNIEAIANGLKKQDPNIDVITLNFILKERPDKQRIGQANLKIYKQ